MIITCAKHGTVLTDEMRCEQCLAQYRIEYLQLSEGRNCTVSLPVTPTDILVNGNPGTLYHRSEYIERSVPAALAGELNAYLDRRLAEYEEACGCVSCLKQKETR